jgi:hypothetical protein
MQFCSDLNPCLSAIRFKPLLKADGGKFSLMRLDFDPQALIREGISEMT